MPMTSRYSTDELPFELRLVSADEFQLVLREHRLWLESGGKEGKRANLRNADLREVSFGNADLTEASLRGAMLSAVDLSKTNLRSADLAEANLEDAALIGCNLVSANLARANARRATFAGANLHEAVLNDAILEDVDFTRTRLAKANFRQADLTRATFKETDLREAILRAANLSDAWIERANMTEADCRDARCIGTRFLDALLTDVAFKDADMTGVDFSRSDFSAALEIAPEYRAQSFLDEQRRLRDEQAELKRIQEEIVGERRKVAQDAAQFENDRLNIIRQARRHQHFTVELSRRASWFKTMSALWFVMTLFFALVVGGIVSHIDFSQLKLVELGVACIGMLGVMTLITVTAHHASQLVSMFKEYNKDTQQLSAALQHKLFEDSGEPSLSAESPSAAGLDLVRQKHRAQQSPRRTAGAPL